MRDLSRKLSEMLNNALKFRCFPCNTGYTQEVLVSKKDKLLNYSPVTTGPLTFIQIKVGSDMMRELSDSLSLALVYLIGLGFWSVLCFIRDYSANRFRLSLLDFTFSWLELPRHGLKGY